MIQKTSASNKQQRVSALRDSRHGCGTQANVKKPRREIYGDVLAVTNGKGKNLVGSGSGDHSNHRPNEAESLDVIMKRAGFNVTAKGTVGSGPSGRSDPLHERNYNPSRGSKVILISSEESKKLLSSQCARRPLPVTVKKTVVVKAVMKKKESNASTIRANANKPTQDRDEGRSTQLERVPATQQNRVPRMRVNAAVQKRFSDAHNVTQDRDEGQSTQLGRVPVTQQNRVPRMRVNAAVQKKFSNADNATQERDERQSDQPGRVPVRQQNRVPKMRVNAAVKNHPIQRVEQEPADQDDDVVAVPGPNGQERVGYDPTAREKVLEVLRLFKQVYKRLDREKEARRGGDLFQATSRIDYKTINEIDKMGKKVNVEKRIGSVPGIKVGDEFQYKTELCAVGLHSKPMSGIDYMKVGDTNFATCIVATESYGYKNKFDSGVITYTGEGGNVISRDKRTHDQKLTKGNLALANSMKDKRQVRVVRGEERRDKKGKRYEYLGLYLIEKYWAERVRGNVVYKFKLIRIPGQPPLT